MGQKGFFTKTKVLILAVVLAAGLGGGGWLLANSSSEQPYGETAAEQPQQPADDYVTYQGEGGKTALELLKIHAEVETDQYDFGELVTSINGVASDGSKYWTFYVNDQMASEGAGDYETEDSDVIEWKLQ